MNSQYIRSGGYFIPDLKRMEEASSLANGDECIGTTSKNTIPLSSIAYV